MDVLGPTAGGTLFAVTTDRMGTSGYNNSDLIAACAEPGPPPASNRDYTFCFGGSSFATPVAAGVAGLILSLDNLLTRDAVQRLLQDTADKVSDSLGAYSDRDWLLGSGRRRGAHARLRPHQRFRGRPHRRPFCCRRARGS